MVSFTTLVCAAVAGFSLQANSAALGSRCGWVGCTYDAGLIKQSDHLSTLAITSSAIVADIQTLTKKSQALQPVAQSISIINGPLLVVGMGPFPQIVRGFTDIITVGTGMLGAYHNAKAFDDQTSCDEIFNAWREFVRVHQMLLSILSSKAGLFTTVPTIGAPVAAVLRQDEAIVDTLAFTLISLATLRSSDLQSQGSSLSATLAQTIKAYEELQV